MHAALVLLHVALAGLWLGCVLTEVLFERTLLAGDRTSHRTLAELHARVDLFVELPAFASVLLTGLALLSLARPTGLAVHLMMSAGAVAIAANVVCVALVLRRRQAARDADWPRFDRLDHLQHRLGAVVLLGVLLALGAGMYGRLA